MDLKIINIVHENSSDRGNNHRRPASVVPRRYPTAALFMSWDCGVSRQLVAGSTGGLDDQHRDEERRLHFNESSDGTAAT
jgi:hypothetical protein